MYTKAINNNIEYCIVYVYDDYTHTSFKDQRYRGVLL